MFLKNLIKAISITGTIYFIAFMAVLWDPWNSYLSFITIDSPDKLREMSMVGFLLYQSLVISFPFFMSIVWMPSYSKKEVSFLIALFIIPMMVTLYYGTESFFSVPFGTLQVISTTVFIYLFFHARERRQPQIPA